MIQINLLPDVKLEFIKTKRTKRMITLASLAVIAFSLFITISLFTVVNVAQKNHISNLNEDIAAYSKELSDTPDLNKILTVQNQLNNLTALHDNKVVSSRLYKYLTQLTPNEATITGLKIDFVNNTLTISGTANGLDTVNKYVDTIKFTKYKTQGSAEEKNAFSNTVLTSYTINDENVNYQIDTQFDPVIFDNAAEVELTVPKIITTRSTTDSPQKLFTKPVEEED